MVLSVQHLLNSFYFMMADVSGNIQVTIICIVGPTLFVYVCACMCAFVYVCLMLSLIVVVVVGVEYYRNNAAQP